MILKLNKINKSYDFKEVLKDVSFEIGKEELVYLSGPNGSGKTTLLKLIATTINRR